MIEIVFAIVMYFIFIGFLIYIGKKNKTLICFIFGHIWIKDLMIKKGTVMDSMVVATRCSRCEVYQIKDWRVK